MDFFIQTSLCNYVVNAPGPTEAWVKVMTSDIHIKDMFIEREDLLKRGYNKMEQTLLKNVYSLEK